MFDPPMQNIKRLQYLQAMGIDVWLPQTSFSSKINAKIAQESIDKTVDFSQNITQVWQKLEHNVSVCKQCSLSQTRTQTVFGAGNKNAQWMLVGEGPGQNEDCEGLPFVGFAGQLLTEMIRALGLAREQVYITNILKCRPPDNRNPQPEEAAACKHYLQQQIALVQPKIILAIGKVAAQNLLQTDAPLQLLRNKMHYLDDIPLVVIYHPAYLLRSLLEKRKAWQDLQNALACFRDDEN